MIYVSGYRHNRILTIFFVLISFGARISGQSSYHVEGKYAGASAQGMAIWKDRAYLLNNTGICRVFDLKQDSILTTFRLASYGKDNHANCAAFGAERTKGGFPLMYVSQCGKPHKCFVEEMRDTNSVLVQTITLHQTGMDEIAHDWVVDRKTKSLYAISNLKSFFKAEKRNVHRVTRYRLPRLKEGSQVTLTDADVLGSFDVEFPNLLQGACIKGKYLYLPVGLHKGNEKRDDHERALIVVNLKRGAIERTVSIQSVTDNEPEDCDFYKGKLLLFCGQRGGIYEIPTK